MDEPRRIEDWDKNIDGFPLEDFPDFNGWVKALEADPDYIAKQEKMLDDELGKDRLI